MSGTGIPARRACALFEWEPLYINIKFYLTILSKICSISETS